MARDFIAQAQPTARAAQDRSSQGSKTCGREVGQVADLPRNVEAGRSGTRPTMNRAPHRLARGDLLGLVLIRCCSGCVASRFSHDSPVLVGVLISGI